MGEMIEYKRAMQAIEHEANTNAQNVERKMESFERERNAIFAKGHNLVKAAEEKMRGKRDNCEEELEAVHARLRVVEEETRAHLKQILAEWFAGSKATEERIRQIEQDGEQIVRQMQESINNCINDAMNTHASLQQG